ncbi:MAG: hypothetical protein M5R36_16455 [Deltaproteobacteria bacterium]|nr:hypothetical protein [Deltaproteobacteria bacterium]
MSITQDHQGGGGMDRTINPRGGYSLYMEGTYASPKMAEPFTGAKMGSDIAGFYGDPGVITLEEAESRPDENYLLKDYGFVRGLISYKKFLPMPFWDLKGLNDALPIKGFDWDELGFERWRRQRHTLVLKGVAGFTHSDIPEGFGYGNSFGRVHFYDRFAGGGMFVTGLGAFNYDGAFLGYENYSLEGENMVILGFDYRFPLIKEIDKSYWGFYFDKLYFSFFGDAGNFWSHVNQRKDMFNFDKVFDKSGDGKFDVNDDLLTDAGIEFRLSMYLFNYNWDSFFKVAHGFQDKERFERPFRFYLGLGTGFGD